MPEPNIPCNTTTKDVRSPATRKRQGYFNPATGLYDAEDNEPYLRARLVSRLYRDYMRGLLSETDYADEMQALAGYLPSAHEEGGHEE